MKENPRYKQDFLLRPFWLQQPESEFTSAEPII